MPWIDSLSIALQSLWANKLRTALTLLGMIIGVSSVILVITLVNGANHYVATKISGHGADVFTVSKTDSVIFDAETWRQQNRRKDLIYDDFRELTERCTQCALLGAQLQTTGKVVHGNQSSTSSDIRGWTPSMQEMTATDIGQGRGLNEVDERLGSHDVVVGADVVKHLMQGVDPIGQEIRVDGDVYTVVGVGAPKGTTLGQSQDDYVYMPLSTYMHSHGLHQSLDYFFKARTGGAGMQEAMDEVRVLLRQLRRDRPGAPDDFTLESNGSLVSLWSSLTSTFSTVLVGVASISLVIGGVVIMNIMLVSVTERTREIGIRKALGARRADLLLQFLMESATMALFGGILGVAIGAGFSYAIAAAIGWPALVSVWSVLAGLFVSTSVGIFFGVYPASKAARLDPITALRSEL